MVIISKNDWNLFRDKLTYWQEHYMEQLTKEYIELLSSPGNASDHFWELDGILQCLWVKMSSQWKIWKTSART